MKTGFILKAATDWKQDLFLRTLMGGGEGEERSLGNAYCSSIVSWMENLRELSWVCELRLPESVL